MGFFDSFKRVLGFDGSDDNDIEIEGIDATVTPLSKRNTPTPDRSRGSEAMPGQRPSKRTETPEAPPEQRPDPSVIFEKVVAMFNETLPGFLQKSVDPERQRQALYDALDGSMRNYFEQLERNTERRLQVRFEADRRRLQGQIDELKEKAQKEEEGVSNAKNLQLSAERQKRALSERVHDLEKQMATLEAENEQYILENKSMANKLRMASMNGDVPDEAMIAELGKRDEQILELQKLSAEAEKHLAALKEEKAQIDAKLADAESRIDAMQKQIDAQSTSESDEAELLVNLKAENVELHKYKENAEVEIEKLRDALEQAKVKDELGVAMVNDLNTKTREAREEAAVAQEVTKEAEEKFAQAQKELAAVSARLAKAQEDLKVVKEIQEEVKQLEENQQKADAQMRQQKDQLMEKDEQIKQLQSDLESKNNAMRMQEETIRRLEDQTDSLRKNIETTIYEKGQVEVALRSEIERLKSVRGSASIADLEIVEKPVAIIEVKETMVTNAEAEEDLDMPEFVMPKQQKVETPKPKRGRPPKPHAVDAPDVAVDSKQTKEEEENDLELLDSTDWLIASAADELKPKRQRRKKESSDDSFGYKEPERQDPPDSPAQMLLW